MSNTKYPEFTTPPGKAISPWLNKPDTKFDEDGCYKVDLIVDAEAAQPLIDKIESRLTEFVAEVQKEARRRQNVSDYRIPYTENGDGTVTFKLKQNAKIKGEDVTLKFFDSKINSFTNPPVVEDGSVLAISGIIRGYVSGNNKGLTMGIHAVQIIELTRNDFGFVKQRDGFEISYG